MDDKKLPPITFSSFVTSLASSALINLGILPHPQTGKTERDIKLAKYTIDTLDMLKEKTKNNLTEEEENILTEVLAELKLKYVEISKHIGAGGENEGKN